jgi:hypothetical protein
MLSIAANSSDWAEQMPESERIAWRLAIVESRWRIGQREDALADLEKLEADYPRSLEVRQSIGQLLVDATDPKARELALRTWRAIAAGTSAQSDLWFEAKFRIAQLLATGGAEEEATKMLRFLQAVPPGWSQSRRAADFDKLLHDLSSGEQR